MYRSRTIALTLFMLLPITIGGITDSFAQTVPGALVPGRQEEKQVPTVPIMVPRIETPPMKPQVAPPGSEEIFFDLKSLDISGNKAIATEKLSDLWKPYIGRKISVAQIFDITNAITSRYAAKGYMISFALVPQQQITDGIITLNVVEGKVSKVSFQKEDGSAYPNVTPLIESLGQNIVESKPLKSADLERALMLMNDQGGMTASATFAPDKGAEGGSELIVTLKHQPFGVIVSGDNRLAEDLGRWNGRATVIGQSPKYGTVSVTKGCGLFCNVYNSTAIAWSKMLTPKGLQLSLQANHSAETPEEGILSAVDFHGVSRSYRAELSYPVVRSRDENLTVGVASTTTNDKTKTFAGALTHDRVSAASLFMQYSKLDSWRGMNVVRLDLEKGLPMFQATKDGDAFKSRASGSSSYISTGIYASRQQSLDIISPKLEGFSVFASGKAQRAMDSALLSGQQCFYGGEAFGRAYANGAISGDHCMMGSLELRRDFSLNIKDNPIGAQLYAFTDGGSVWRKGTLLAGDDGSDSAFSAGGGLRLGLAQNIDLDMQVAYPLTASATSNGKKSPRAIFAFLYRFDKK